jgi:hypothetical protein
MFIMVYLNYIFRIILILIKIFSQKSPYLRAYVNFEIHITIPVNVRVLPHKLKV